MKAEEMLRGVFETFDEGILQRLYKAASVDDARVLADFAAAGHVLPEIKALQSVDVQIIDPIVDRYIRSARRSAAVSGASLGIGGWVGVPPGLLHMMVVLIRLAQRTSLAYGFDYRTPREEVELWKTLALAVDANLEWDGKDTDVLRRLPAVFRGSTTFANPLLAKAFRAVAQRVASLAGKRVSRLLPVLGGGTGLVLNYLEVDRVGRRMKSAFRSRHAVQGFDSSTAVEVEVLNG